MITFYYGSGSPYAWRVWLALEHKNLKYDFRLMSFSAGDLKTPAFLKLNPRGRIPLIVDGDFVLSESGAIVEYLEEQYPATAPLFPGPTRQRALVRRWIADIDDSVDAAMGSMGKAVFDKDASAQALGQAREGLLKELEYVAARMEGDYLAGAQLTAADFALYPTVAMLARYDLRKPELEMAAACPSALAAWARRIEGLPYFARTLPPHWKAK
ncbi:MAG TPA: glutathione S-transferase family protein [Burkholderiales bacterium]|nr:glutathione S-transferase family protein [Burkholderiales bacterium]